MGSVSSSLNPESIPRPGLTATHSRAMLAYPLPLPLKGWGVAARGGEWLRFFRTDQKKDGLEGGAFQTVVSV